MMKPLSLRRHYGGVLLAVFLICLLAAGCGKPKGSVSGRVTYKDKPLTAGYVTFTPENSHAVSGTIDSQGNYRVENIPVGMAKITVRADPGTSMDAFAKVNNPKDPKSMMSALMPKNIVKLPDQYNNPEKSGLTCEVKKGSQEHNIELK